MRDALTSSARGPQGRATNLYGAGILDGGAAASRTSSGDTSPLRLWRSSALAWLVRRRIVKKSGGTVARSMAPSSGHALAARRASPVRAARSALLTHAGKLPRHRELGDAPARRVGPRLRRRACTAGCCWRARCPAIGLSMLGFASRRVRPLHRRVALGTAALCLPQLAWSGDAAFVGGALPGPCVDRRQRPGLPVARPDRARRQSGPDCPDRGRLRADARGESREMSLKIDQDHSRFRAIVRGRIRQNLRKYISQGELVGRKGKDLVSIPIPQIDIPHFSFGDKQQRRGRAGRRRARAIPMGGDPSDEDGEGRKAGAAAGRARARGRRHPRRARGDPRRRARASRTSRTRARARSSTRRIATRASAASAPSRSATSSAPTAKR